jgi:hypothetical protein
MWTLQRPRTSRLRRRLANPYHLRRRQQQDRPYPGNSRSTTSRHCQRHRSLHAGILSDRRALYINLGTTLLPRWTPFTNAMHRAAEALDRTFTKAYHHQAWSPQLIERGLVLKNWKIVLAGSLRKCGMSAIYVGLTLVHHAENHNKLQRTRRLPSRTHRY